MFIEKSEILDEEEVVLLKALKGELLKSGTGRDGMGQSRILNYGTGLDTKTYLF